MPSFAVQEQHVAIAASANSHRAEVYTFAADKADLTRQVLGLRGDLQVKENELVLARRHADLAESTQRLDRDEIDQLKHDARKIQNEHAADLEYLSQLSAAKKVIMIARFLSNNFSNDQDIAVQWTCLMQHADA